MPFWNWGNRQQDNPNNMGQNPQGQGPPNIQMMQRRLDFLKQRQAMVMNRLQRLSSIPNPQPRVLDMISKLSSIRDRLNAKIAEIQSRIDQMGRK